MVNLSNRGAKVENIKCGTPVKLNALLQFKEWDILHSSGKISVEAAKVFAQSEYEKYCIKQGRIYKSSFDKLLAKPSGIKR